MGIYIGEGTGQDYSAMRGPCPVGYHVPMDSEWQDVLDILTTIGYDNDLKKGVGLVSTMGIPMGGQRAYSTSNAEGQGSYGIYWCSTNSYRCIDIRGTSTQFKNYYKGYGYLIRPFKDVAVVPDSSWTKIDDYQVATGGIYRNATLGLISLSGDGTNWITITDKNLGATIFYDATGTTISELTCGKYYQRGNNYGFPFTGTVTTSSTAVDTTGYGPGNYYSSSTFITLGSWYSNTNNDLRGGETGIVKFPNVEEIFVGEGIDNYEAMRGPCPEGFHVPSKSELQTITNAGIVIGAWNSDGTGGGNMLSYFKIPLSGYHGTNIRGAGTSYQDKQAYLWCCTATSSYYGDSRRFGGATSTYNDKWKIETYVGRGSGNFIRPIKDVPVAPDGNWTTLYNGSSTSAGAGIFHNSTLGLISISSDGTNWTTIADKNLGATVVYNSGDTLSESNCGGWFQWGNNYMFPFSDSFTYDTEQVDATNYGPGNYYSSSIYIGKEKWDTSNNKNLRGGQTGITKKGNVIEVYQGTTKIRPLKTYQGILDMATAEGNPRTNTIAELNSMKERYHTSLGGYLTTRVASNSQQYDTIDGISYVQSGAGTWRIGYRDGNWYRSLFNN